MMFLTMAQLIATLSVYARDTVGLTNPELGWVYSANAFIVVLFQLLVSGAIRGRNLLQVLMVGSFLYSLGYSLMAIPDSLTGILVLIGLITLAEMMVGPAATSMVAKIAPDKKNGQYMGAFGLFGTLGWSLGPFIGGLLLDFAPTAILLWLGVSLFGLIGAGGYFWLNRKYPELRH
jgi:DHA1 family multidrug resistance protein-like MFS transporter